MTAAIGAVTAATGMSGAQLAFSGISTVAKMQASRAQAKGLAAQATMARLQAKQEALKYKQQAVQVLDNILRTQSTITARAGAGGIDAFTGSASRLGRLAMAQGAQELYTVQDNEIIALRGGAMQAQQYMSAAKATMQTGFLGGGLSLAKPLVRTPLGDNHIE